MFKLVGYGLLMLASFFFSRGQAEAFRPPETEGEKKVLVYSRSVRLTCLSFLGVLAQFAIAFADLKRASVLERIGLFSMLALPIVFFTLVIFGWRIVVTPDSIARTWFGRLKWERKRNQLVEVSYSQTAGAYMLRFADGTGLRMSNCMQGSHQVASELAEALPRPQLPEGGMVLVYETTARVHAGLLFLMAVIGGCVCLTAGDSILLRVGALLMFVVPTSIHALEILGAKISVTPEIIRRSCFGLLAWERKRSEIVGIDYSRYWGCFLLRFADGKRLRVPGTMKGCEVLLGTVHEALVKSGPAA